MLSLRSLSSVGPEFPEGVSGRRVCLGGGCVWEESVLVSLRVLTSFTVWYPSLRKRRHPYLPCTEDTLQVHSEHSNNTKTLLPHGQDTRVIIKVACCQEESSTFVSHDLGSVLANTDTIRGKHFYSLGSQVSGQL